MGTNKKKISFIKSQQKSVIKIHQKHFLGPGQVAQLVRVSSPYTQVAGIIPGQGT